MKTTESLSTTIRGVFTQPTDGVVGLVDDLLQICADHDLQLDLQPDSYRFRANDGNWEELNNVTLRKSVFRAMIARVAALCNERAANSTSPHQGNGKIAAGKNSACEVECRFVNTPDIQKLEIFSPVPQSKANGQPNKAVEEYPQVGRVALP